MPALEIRPAKLRVGGAGRAAERPPAATIGPARRTWRGSCRWSGERGGGCARRSGSAWRRSAPRPRRGERRRKAGWRRRERRPRLRPPTSETTRRRAGALVQPHALEAGLGRQEQRNPCETAERDRVADLERRRAGGRSCLHRSCLHTGESPRRPAPSYGGAKPDFAGRYPGVQRQRCAARDGRRVGATGGGGTSTARRASTITRRFRTAPCEVLLDVRGERGRQTRTAPGSRTCRSTRL